MIFHPKYEVLLNGIQEFRNCRVLIVGDIGLDEYLRGHVSRVSPEAPVPVLEATKQDFALGLAANVAQNIKSLGGQAHLIGVVGEDEAARKLKNLLKRKEIQTSSLILDKNRVTTRKIRVLSRNQHMLRLDYEHSKPLSKGLQKEIVFKTKNLISKCDGLVIQDYAKGTLNENTMRELIQVAHLHKKKVIVDPHRKTSLKSYLGAHIFKPNQEEALILSSFKEKETDLIRKNSIEKEKFYQKIAYKLLDQLASEFVVLTRGDEGISLYSKNKTVHFPTQVQSVYDVTGAGDTVLAVLSLGVFSGLGLPDSCMLSNLAAGQVIKKVGAVSCTKEELKKSLKKIHLKQNQIKKEENKKKINSYFSNSLSPFLENPLDLSSEENKNQK